MRVITLILSALIFFTCIKCYSEEYLYILNDSCINDLTESAQNYFKNRDINVIRDSRGIILRFKLTSPTEEYEKFSSDTYNKILYTEQFLAKIKNPVIIEVHTEKFSDCKFFKRKNWEISTVIANRIEALMLKNEGLVLRNRINSVGYGEFLPSKNTPYNGGNYPSRVDIIILCSISGE